MTIANPPSRRRFLKAAGLTIAGATLTCAGLGVAATRPPAVELPDRTLEGEQPVNNRILVTYATRAGSTAEIATTIAETMAARGYSVDLKPVNEKPDLTGYAAVVLGSAIRMGRWLPEAVDFVKAHQTTLNAVPVALFTVHMLNTGDDEASRTGRLAYLNDIRPLLPDAGEVYFTGAMDFKRLSFLDRLIAKMVGAIEEDRRDWGAIKQWAHTVEMG